MFFVLFLLLSCSEEMFFVLFLLLSCSAYFEVYDFTLRSRS